MPDDNLGPSLLVGNGPNRVASVSWAQLINDLASEFGVSINDVAGSIPFPLLYERIFLEAAKRQPGDTEKTVECDIKRAIAKQVKRIKSTGVHDRIAELGFEQVLTTNYDLALEHAVEQAYGVEKEEYGRQERDDYNLFRAFRVGASTIWHIHGHCELPESIMIGYAQYSAHLQRMRERAIGTVLPRLRRGECSEDSWMDAFFHRQIYVLGLELDFAETHLWWLLTYRARLKPNSELSLDNQIHYLLPSWEYYAPEQQAKVSMLKAVDVQAVPIDSPDMNWTEFYRDAIEWLRIHM